MMTSLLVPPRAAERSGWPTAAATLTVDHTAFAHNLGVMRRVSGVDVLAVVKANGFGLGAVPLARTAAASGATALGVATIDEAIALRTAGLTLPILAWLPHPGADLATALRLQIDIACGTEEMLTAVAATATVVGVKARVHLEADTGMHRGGASPLEWPELCRAAARLERAGTVRVVGVWSHLANPGHPHWSAVANQVDAFTLALGSAYASGLQPEHHHIASSGAALAHPRTRFTLVRAGAGLYGIEPVEGHEFGLRPVVRVAARIVQVKRVRAGSAVGYGAGHVTQDATTLAVVPFGYADGVPRSLANTGEVSVGGIRCRIVGAVSMDQIVVDLGTGPAAAAVAGDEIVLIGDPQAGEPSLAEVAQWAGTIPQEILTGLGDRFARVHEGAQNVA